MQHTSTPRRGAGRLIAAVAAAAVGSALLSAALAPTARASSLSLGTPALKATGPITGTVDCASADGGCDLYARAGSVTVGAASLPVWNFTTTPGGTVTGANPVIEAAVDDTLTIRVHNDLPTGSPSLALAIPGVARSAATGFDPMPDYTGAAVGAVRTYQVTVDRPGTYLYQAGHLNQAGHLAVADPGPREAAMGLAGALVVRPRDGNGAPDPSRVLGQATPGSSFDDEAVLVLSEIDPAFAADPMHFDLREFTGRYRLINGQAWPAIPAIGTGVGNHLALRYVNAGVSDASMGLLGLKQYVVAQDAYPRYGQALVAETLQPGTTEDVIVAMPPTDTSVLLVDSTGNLDTNGELDASGRIALGGRMVKITTDAVNPPTGDTSGPTVSGLTLSPAQLTAQQAVTSTTSVTLSATFTDPTVNGLAGGDVTAAEYTFDPNAAPGSGTTITVSPANPVTLTGPTAVTIPQSAFAGRTGALPVYVRAQDVTGNWGQTSTVTLYIASGGPTVRGLAVTPSPTNGAVDVTLSATADDTAFNGTVTALGFALGADSACTLDGGFNACFPMTFTTGSGAVQAAQAVIPKASLQPDPNGDVTITVKALDSNGLIGVGTVVLPVDATKPVASNVTVSPDPTNGTVGTAVDPTSVLVRADFTDVIPNVNASSALVGAEGFLGAPGTPGTGFVLVADDGAFDSPTESAYGLIPLSEITALSDGGDTVNVHALDAAGNWGDPTPVTFTVDRTPPQVTGLTATATGTAGTATLSFTAADATTGLTAIEYFVGTTDPGAGNGVAVTPVQQSSSVSVPNLPSGTSTLAVRAKDGAGNWSAPVTTTVTIAQPALPDLIFADSFGTTGSGWAGQPWTPTGSPTRVATQAAWGMDGRALRAASTTTPSFVTTPALNPAESHYLARVRFRPTNLVTGTSAGTDGVTVLHLTSGGSPAASVRFRRVTGTSRGQLGLQVGTGPITWSTTLTRVSSTTYTVRLDYTAGGDVKLYVNTSATAAPALVATIGGAGAAVDSAALGRIDSGPGITGRPILDGFVSNRTTLPQ